MNYVYGRPVYLLDRFDEVSEETQERMRIMTNIENIYTNVYTNGVKEADVMETAKLFTNGGSQAVRLPKNCRFDDDEVYVNRVGNAMILLPKNDPWSSAIMGLSMFSDDFMKDYEDLPVQERDPL